jgi:hypothetical protein
LILFFHQILFLHLFHSITQNDYENYVANNSTAMCKALKNLHPGGIRTDDIFVPETNAPPGHKGQFLAS